MTPVFDVPLILGLMRMPGYKELARPDSLADWIKRRLDEGLDLFDHADIYGNGECESRFGEALASQPGLAGKIRVITKADIVTAHADGSPWKVKHYNTEADYLRASVDSALKRLKVERIHCFLLHRPDPLMNPEATARVLEDLVAEGKIAHIGVSNFAPEQWRLLQQHCSLPLVCNQIELSLQHTGPLFDGTLEALQRDQQRLLAWSPLGGGRFSEAELDEVLDQSCRETGLTVTGLRVAWLRRLPGTPIPVIGSMRESRIAEALAGARYEMPRALWFRLLEASRGHRVA